MCPGARLRPIRTWRSRGHGRSTRRSNGREIASHFGGTRQGSAISWAGPHQRRRRRPQPVPPHHRHRADDPRSRRPSRQPEVVNGIEQKPINASRVASHDLHFRQGRTFRRSDDPHHGFAAYFEMVAKPRRIDHDGCVRQYRCSATVPPWVLNAPMPDVSDYGWELSNARRGGLKIPSSNDLAAPKMRGETQRNAGVF